MDNKIIDMLPSFNEGLTEVLEKEENAILFLYLAKMIEEDISFTQCLSKYAIERIYKDQREKSPRTPSDYLRMRIEVDCNIRLIPKPHDTEPNLKYGSTTIYALETAKISTIQMLAKKLNVF